MGKMNSIITSISTNQIYPKNYFEKQLDTVFDLIKVEGRWLCEEDKKLFHKQEESEGKIVYMTHRPAPNSTRI